LEHNSDKDWAGYLNLLYALGSDNAKIDFSTGGLYRDKQRTNFYNAYLFLPYDEDKPSMNNSRRARRKHSSGIFPETSC